MCKPGWIISAVDQIITPCVGVWGVEGSEGAECTYMWGLNRGKQSEEMGRVKDRTARQAECRRLRGGRVSY